MIPETILNEMTQREGEKTHNFLARQQTAKNVIRKMNALEVHLAHLMADEEPKGRMGDSIYGRQNKTRSTPSAQTKESVRSIT